MKHFTKVFSILMVVTMAFAVLPVGGVLAQAPIPPPTDTTPPLVTSVTIAPQPVKVNTDETLTAVIDDSTTGGSTIASAEFSLNGGPWTPMTAVENPLQITETFTATFKTAKGGSNTVCVHGTDAANNKSLDNCVTFNAQMFVFGKFLPPLGKGKTNMAKAGRTIPVKWTLFDLNGKLVKAKSSFVAVETYAVDCKTGVGDPTTAVKEAFTGKTALRFNGHFFMVNWKTPKAYAGTCRSMFLLFSDNTMSPAMQFNFK